MGRKAAELVLGVPRRLAWSPPEACPSTPSSGSAAWHAIHVPRQARRLRYVRVRQ